MSNSTRILIASDHAGYKLKESLLHTLTGFEFKDMGPFDTARVDYPEYADRVCREIAEHGGRAVLICGSGQGMMMRANRYPTIRAALVYDEDSARLSRQHNDANIICLGARSLTAERATSLVKLFFSTKFEGGRHSLRVEMVNKSIG